VKHQRSTFELFFLFYSSRKGSKKKKNQNGNYDFSIWGATKLNFQGYPTVEDLQECLGPSSQPPHVTPCSSRLLTATAPIGKERGSLILQARVIDSTALLIVYRPKTA